MSAETGSPLAIGPVEGRPEEASAWYCVRTAPKQENKVAKLVARETQAEVFAPKIRFGKVRGDAPIWWTEALFPGYVFARFQYFQLNRQIRSIGGVATIVTFGQEPAALSDETFAALRRMIGEGDTVEVATTTEPDSEVLVISGPLQGLQLLVTRVIPARRRIAVLFEILGCEREVEVDVASVVPIDPRSASVASTMHR